jgi:predicted ATP-grasp superfamily ATP-dependent carboligase
MRSITGITWIMTVVGADMTRIFVYEPLSAEEPDSAEDLERDSPGHDELLAAGRAMRNAIVADLARLGGIGVTAALSQQEARHAALGPRIMRASARAGEPAVEFVRRQARAHDLCWVVAPETGGLLSRLHEAVGNERWVGCSGPAIRVASSKTATCAALDAAGILTPSAFASAHRGRWIVKPDDGAGAVDTRRHATHDAAQADVQRRQRAGLLAVAQPFVEGEALSISLIVGPDLARPVAFNRQRLEIDVDGYVHDLGVHSAAIGDAEPRAAALRALAAKVAAALPGLRGYVGIDVVWNEEEGPVVIEVNPRVTCAYVGLSAILRRNLAADILRVHARIDPRQVAVDVAA